MSSTGRELIVLYSPGKSWRSNDLLERVGRRCIRFVSASWKEVW